MHIYTLYNDLGRTLTLVYTKKGCGVSPTLYIQEPSGHSHVPCTLLEQGAWIK